MAQDRRTRHTLNATKGARTHAIMTSCTCNDHCACHLSGNEKRPPTRGTEHVKALLHCVGAQAASLLSHCGTPCGTCAIPQRPSAQNRQHTTTKCPNHAEYTKTKEGHAASRPMHTCSTPMGRCTACWANRKRAMNFATHTKSSGQKLHYTQQPVPQPRAASPTLTAILTRMHAVQTTRSDSNNCTK